MEFYNPFDNEDFDYENCFLCGKEIEEEEKSLEHIFPKWIQKKFDLWNKRLTLTNGTSIEYRQLTIPCCKECNSVHLSQVENVIKSLVESPIQNLNEEEEQIVVLWVMKIFYGMIYKNLSLSLDRKKPQGNTLLSPKEVESYSALHLMLQASRFKTNFISPKPWSVFIFEYENEDFHYISEYNLLCCSLKLGNVGISVSIQDNNMVEQFLKPFAKLKKHKLNTNNFIEITSYIVYTKSLLTGVPKYMAHYSETAQQMNIEVLNTLPMSSWNDQSFVITWAQYLLALGYKPDKDFFNLKTSNIPTTLFDENGNSLIHNTK